MSERGGQRPNPDLLAWARVDQTEVATPGSGLQDSGYPDGAIPANEEHNSEFYELDRQMQHLQAQVPRVFDSLAEALDQATGEATAVAPEIVDGEIFVARSLSSGALRQPGQLAELSAIGSAILAVAADGQRKFWAVGINVSAEAAAGGAASSWGPIDVGNTVASLEADGRFVYVGTEAPGFRILDRSDGSTIAAEALDDSPLRLAANGEYLVIAGPDGDGIGYVYTDLGATPTDVGDTANHGAQLTSCAIDHNQGYVAGLVDPASLNSVRAFLLSVPGSYIWSTMLPAINDLAADGRFVYACGDVAETAVCVWCLDRETGSIIWGAELPGGDDADWISVDHNWLWVSGASGDCYVLDRSSGALVRVVADFDARVTDGFLATGIDGTDLEERYGAEPETYFLKAVSTDPNRRPVYALAAPVNDRDTSINEVKFSTVSVSHDVEATNGTGVYVDYLNSGGGPGNLIVELAAGTYLVHCYAAYEHPTANATMSIRLRLGTGNVFEYELDGNQIGGTTFPKAFAVIKPLVLTAGTQVFGLDFREEIGGTGEAHLFEASITVQRIA